MMLMKIPSTIQLHPVTSEDMFVNPLFFPLLLQITFFTEKGRFGPKEVERNTSVKV